MKKYFSLVRSDLKSQYCYKSIIDLVIYFDRYLINSYKIVEVEPIGRVEFVGSDRNPVYKIKDYTVIKEYSFEDLMDIFKKTKDWNLLRVIFDFDEITEKDILLILEELEKVKWKKDIYKELFQILRYPKITENILERIIDLIERESEVLIELASHPKSNEKILKKVVDKTYESKYFSYNSKLNILLAVSKNSNITTELIDDLFAKVKKLKLKSVEDSNNPDNNDYKYSYKNMFPRKPNEYKKNSDEILINISNNIKTSGETLDFLAYCSDGMALLNISKNPNTFSETLKKILNEKAVGTAVLISIINHPNVNDEIIDLIIEKYYDVLIIFEILSKSPEITSSSLNKIIMRIKELERRSSVVLCLINNPKLTKESLELLIEKCDIEDIGIIAKSELLNQNVIDNLFKKVNETLDFDLFEKLLCLEKIMIRIMCQDKTCDNKLNFRKEYLKSFGKYLKSGFIEIKLKVLEEMLKEGYLTEENIIDKDYIKECPRSLKLCSLLSKI